MNWWQRWRQRDQDLDDEIRAHLAMETQYRIERGDPPDAAAGAARREFGNELLVREVTRDMWSWMALERFARDFRLVFRQMRRSPGFTAVAVLSLALGLGAATAMFSIVNGVLLEPLKYSDPARLYMAQTVVAARFKATTPWPVNARHFDEWRKHGRSWEQIALVDGLNVTLTGKGEPQQLSGFAVSSNFFRTLGVQPALGRDFFPEEERPGHSHVVILADSLWRTRFAADPSVVGQTILLDGEPDLVVGVMPPWLRLPKGAEWGTVFTGPAAPVIFRPLGFDVSQGRASGNYNHGSIMRLRPGVQPQQAIAEMNALIADFVRQFHVESKPGLTPMQAQVTGGVHSALWLLMGTVGAVLLIVCVNIGNLMLIRTAGRYREAGVRLALGASRGQLFSLILKEVVALVTIGGSLGLGLAYGGLRAFVAAAPVSLPRLDEIHMDWRVVAFSFAAMLLATLLCGMVPAWKLSKIQPQESIKAGAANTTELGRRLRFREVLVGAEVALSTVLLVVGGLLMVSFFRLLGSDKGFEVSHVIAQDFSLSDPAYTAASRRTFIESALLKLRSLPGVESASLADQVPFRGESAVCGLRDPDHLADPAHPEAASNFAGLASYHFVAPDYWKTLGIPLRKGRALEPADQDRKVAVVSESVANVLWPNQNPIGRHVLSCGSIQSTALEVIGVVGETRASLEQKALLTVYQPYFVWGGTFVLRTRSNPQTVIGAVHGVLRSLDSALPLAPARTMQQILDESVSPRRFEMDLAVAFAIVALLLASLGIYGIVSFNVARRTPEIGIRVALGARPPQLVAMVFGQGMLPVVSGFLFGLAGALSAGRLLASQLFGISPRDPVTISTVSILLLIVAAGACLLPAWRATRVDPLRALRSE